MSMMVVVTGASHGIGRATAVAFARNNARLALISRDQQKLEQTRTLCMKAGSPAATIYNCDLTQPEAVQTMADAVLQTAVPDVVVNNAGGFAPDEIGRIDPVVFQNQFDINVTSAMLCTEAFINPMMARNNGCLFYVSSVAGIGPYPRSLAYTTAKHALLGYARSVREVVKTQGIRTMTLIPGAVYTATWGENPDYPEDRMMPPEDLADTIVHLAQLSGRTVVEEILLRPLLGDI